MIFEAVAKGGNQEIPFLSARRVGKTDMLALVGMTLGVYEIHRLTRLGLSIRRDPSWFLIPRLTDAPSSL